MTFFDEWCVTFASLLKKDFGLSDLDCAAVLGNAGHESNGFKSLQEKKPVVPGSKGGYGIMQWTGPRRRAYESYCKRNSLNPADMMSNYKYLFVELKGPEGRVLPKLKAASGLNNKVKVFMDGFLRPGTEHLDSRIVWANRALKAIQTQQTAPVEVHIPGAPPAETVEKQVSDQAPTQRTTIWTLLVDLLRTLLGK